MVLIALGFAVQIPSEQYLIIYVGMIEFVLGVYQLGMSIFLISSLSKKSNLLQIHFFSSIGYLIMLIGLGLSDADWINEERWTFALYILPWGLAILFLVAIDELERARHYHL